MPVWIIAFDTHACHDCQSSNIRLLSGGDDCLLKLWELSVAEDDLIRSHQLVSSSKTALGGVTSADWHPTVRELFATGSYDECVRVWDYRSVRSGPLLELNTGALVLVFLCSELGSNFICKLNAYMINVRWGYMALQVARSEQR